jgi:hypothetical protein
MNDVQVLLASTASGWHLGNVAKAFATRDAWAGLWLADKNSSGAPADKCRRCWPHHLAKKPFYGLTSKHYWEPAFYAFVPIWGRGTRSQLLPQRNVVQSSMGLGMETFDRAERTGALKVLDSPNSPPVTYCGFWQCECDIWCPGEKVIVLRAMIKLVTDKELNRRVGEAAYRRAVMGNAWQHYGDRMLPEYDRGLAGHA